jgi:spore maturation protein CgeB
VVEVVHIGLIGRHRPDSFQANIGEALTSMGHRVTYLGAPGVDRGSRLAVRTTQRVFSMFPAVETRVHHHYLLRAALSRECDAVIATKGRLDPEVVARLRRHRIPVALWFPDAVSNLGRQSMLVAPYTAMFFKDELLVRRLRDTLGLPVWYLPQACNPRHHLPVGEAGLYRHIAVVGNSYPSRLVLVRRLHEAGIPMVLYGSAPPRWARHLVPPGVHAGFPVFQERKSRVFRESAGVLNNLHPAEMHGVNLRTFEATAAGGAVLCDGRPSLAALYEADSEILPYRSFTELVERARELLGDPHLVRKIGDAASRRAHRDHTYQNRLPTILEKLA